MMYCGFRNTFECTISVCTIIQSEHNICYSISVTLLYYYEYERPVVYLKLSFEKLFEIEYFCTKQNFVLKIKI